MKIEEFKQSLRSSLQEACAHNNWNFDNAKQRGMAFEDWCFRLLSDRYPAADNEAEQCIVRGDDAGMDIFFESKETEEIYILQCKHPKIAASDPIPEHEIKSFFSNYELLRDNKYFKQRETKNPKILELAAEFEYWIKQGYLIHFIFVSTGVADKKVAALVEKFNGAKHKANVKFDVWDISGLLVLVKLTAVRHAHRETGIAASLIKTNNTQNTLRAPDFRSNRLLKKA